MTPEQCMARARELALAIPESGRELVANGPRGPIAVPAGHRARAAAAAEADRTARAEYTAKQMSRSTTS